MYSLEIVICIVYRVNYPEKLPQPLEIDSLQHLALRFKLREKNSGKLFTVHQPFVRLSHSVTGQELILVAEKDSTNGYKFELVSNVILFVNVLLYLVGYIFSAQYSLINIEF